MMCVLVDYQILAWAEAGNITPFMVGNINPASIDLTLGTDFIDLKSDREFKIEPDSGLKLQHGMAVLATSVEYVRIPSYLAGDIKLKSTLARSGLDHALAGWIDPGFMGQLTLELHAHREVIIRPGQRIMQLILMKLDAVPANDYFVVGHYFDQRGVTRPWTTLHTKEQS